MGSLPTDKGQKMIYWRKLQLCCVEYDKVNMIIVCPSVYMILHFHIEHKDMMFNFSHQRIFPLKYSTFSWKQSITTVNNGRIKSKTNIKIVILIGKYWEKK